MVWSHDDFVREIHRQLIELESLRKKLSGQAGAEKSLEKLEHSHRQLLRKLHEYFLAGGMFEPDGSLPTKNDKLDPSGSTEKAMPGRRAEPSDAVSGGGSRQEPCCEHDAELPVSSADRGEAGTSRRRRKETRSAARENDAGSGIGRWLVRAASVGKHRPSFLERCEACGKLLVSSILAGEAVVRSGAGWFHKSCFEEGDAFWRPFSLN